MICELIVTSAPRGLQAGRSGFTTVARTRGIHPDLAARLEAASGYRHVYPQGDPRNPVILSYTVKQSALGETSVLSRIGDAGTDYTGRSNKLAHHIALQAADLLSLTGSSPASVLAALVASNRLRAQWAGEPCETPSPAALPAPAVQPGPCQYWASVAGDGGFAGFLVERALKKESTWVISPPGVDLLRLFSEALALVPPGQRWHIPFTTYALRGDEGLWLGTTAGSPEAEAALAQRRIATIDLTQRASAPAESPYVLAARGQAAVPWQRQSHSPVAGPAERRLTKSPDDRSKESPPSGGRPGGPPLPTRPPARAGALTTSLPLDPEEWEDVTVSRPSRAKPVLLAALIAAVLLLGIPLLSYGAYRLKVLPQKLIDTLEVAAWRHNLPFLDKKPPAEVRDARLLLEDITNSINTIRNALGQRDYSKHPSLGRLLATGSELADDLNTKVKKDEDARTLAVTDAAKLITNATPHRDTLQELANKPELRDAHLEAISLLAGLPEQLPEKPEGARKDLRARLEPIAGGSPADIRNLTEVLRQALAAAAAVEPPAPGRQTNTDGGTTVPTDERPKEPVWSLLNRAVQNQKNLPKDGIDRDKESRLVSWEMEASPESLVDVDLLLPEVSATDGSACELSKKQESDHVAWTCRLKNDPNRELGIFKLTPRDLTFVPHKNSSLEMTILPFLPLGIRQAPKDNAGPIAVTWIQLSAPRRITNCVLKPHEAPPLILYESPNTDSQTMQFVHEKLQWRRLSVALRSASSSLLIATSPRDVFKDQLTVGKTDLPNGHFPFLWRPKSLTKSDGFLGLVTLRSDLKHKDTRNAAAASLDFDCWPVPSSRDIASPPLKAKLNRYVSQEATTFSAEDWDTWCRQAFLSSCCFSSPEWQKQKVRQRETRLHEAIRNAATNANIPNKREPDAKRDSMEFDGWLAHVRALLAAQEEYRAYAERVAEKDMGKPKPNNPGEAPVPQGNPSDQAYKDELKSDAFKEKLARWQKQNSEWEGWSQTVQKCVNDDRLLAEWSALQVAKASEPTDDMLLAALWRSAYRFDVVQRHMSGDASQLPVSIEVCVSGDLGISWESKQLPGWDGLPEEARFIVIASLDPCTATEAEPGKPLQPTPSSSSSKEGRN